MLVDLSNMDLIRLWQYVHPYQVEGTSFITNKAYLSCTYGLQRSQKQPQKHIEHLWDLSLKMQEMEPHFSLQAIQKCLPKRLHLKLLVLKCNLFQEPLRCLGL